MPYPLSNACFSHTEVVFVYNMPDFPASILVSPFLYLLLYHAWHISVPDTKTASPSDKEGLLHIQPEHIPTPWAVPLRNTVSLHGFQALRHGDPCDAAAHGEVDQGGEDTGQKEGE